MIARIFSGLWFLLYALSFLAHASISAVALAVLALVAGLAILCGV